MNFLHRVGLIAFGNWTDEDVTTSHPRVDWFFGCEGLDRSSRGLFFDIKESGAVEKRARLEELFIAPSMSTMSFLNSTFGLSSVVGGSAASRSTCLWKP